MFVNPQGVLKIYRNIPWHSDYEHVRQFNSKEERNAFLETNKKYGFENFSYIREQRALRVSINAENLYDCNYISFQNAGFGERIFCAFITDIKYVNTETSEISFVLDFYQTWWYDATIKECFVEREHVNDDTIGLHTVDEGIYFGDYVARAHDNQIFTEWIVQVKFAPSYGEAKKGEYTLKYNALSKQYTVKALEEEMTGDIDTTTAFINDVNHEVGQGNEVIAINLYPKIWKDTWDYTEEHGQYNLIAPSFGRPSNFINGIYTETDEPYTPSNGKLFTYPYCLLRVSNQMDTVRDLKWENFNEFVEGTTRPYFIIRYNYTNKIGCEIFPDLYCNVRGFAETITLNEFPSIDFQATDHLSPLKSVIGTIGTIMSTIAGAGAGAINPALAPVGGSLMHMPFELMGNSMGGFKNNSQTKLGGTNANLALKYNTFGFWFYSMTIKAEYARIIDEYFTRYGYKINRVKAPLLASREKYNYVKTRGAIIENTEGHSLPDEAETEIAKIFDKGVTVWHVNNIGTYGENPIV